MQKIKVGAGIVFLIEAFQLINIEGIREKTEIKEKKLHLSKQVYIDKPLVTTSLLETPNRRY